MRLKNIFWSLAVGGVFALLAGCGGAQVGLNSGTRGDGSIPVGRARGHGEDTLLVTLRFTDGSTYQTSPETNGIVRVPSTVPEGDWQITVSQTAEAHTVSFTTAPKQQKNHLFDVNLLPENDRTNVTGVTLGLSPTIQMRVGSNLKLKPTISGTNVQGLTPSFWTSGGIGKIVPGGVFTAMVPGTGTVTVDVEGFQDSVTIVVTE